MTKGTMIAVAGAVLATGVLMFQFAVPQPVRARACTANDTRGTFGIQLTGWIQNPNGEGMVPFVEGGRLVSNGEGTFHGASVMSVGGFNTSHTFTGTVAVNSDCTARAHVNSSQGWPNLDVFWVIVKPNEEIMLTGQVPGAATHGRALRQY